jgi:hypothetical protein
MKSGLKLFLCLLALLCCVHAVAAVNYEVESVEITPSSGDLSPGDRVTLNAVVTVTSTGDETFPSSHSLEAYTDLDDLKWTYSVKVNGHGEDIVDGKRYLTMTGWLLAYPSSQEVEIHYYLEGKAPEVVSTGDKTLFRLRQFDNNDNLVSNGEYIVQRTVVDPEDVEATLQIREDELEELRESIDARMAEGVNVSPAEEKYTAAESALNSAKTAGPGQAQSYLTQTATLIGEAEDLLDEAWSQARIDAAQSTISEVEDHLTYFKEERGMGSDARVVGIETQLDNAQTLLTLAKDKEASGDYAQARVQADNAVTKASAALNSSVTLREEIGEGGLPIPSFGGSTMTYVLIAVGVLIIGAVGVILYRRHNRWDELG